MQEGTLMKRKGSTGVKVIGILFIIFGILSVISQLFMFAGAAMFTTMLGATAVQSAGFFGYTMGLGILTSVLEIICGILAVKNNSIPSKMLPIIILSCLSIVISAVSIFMFGTSAYGMGILIASIILTAVLPLLMILFAFMVKGSKDPETRQQA
jgi:hypothetical protein